jgi:hypothetical protein
MRTLIVSLVLLGARVAVGAQLLTTAPFLYGANLPHALESALICSVTNASGTRTVTVDIEAPVSDNNDDAGGPGRIVTLPPGNAAEAKFTEAWAYCTFAVTGGTTKDIRAVGFVVNLLGMGEVDIALPAQ